MIFLDCDNVVRYLQEIGRLPRHCRAHADMLAWGVSNIVLRISAPPNNDFVIKQSRKQLRTEVPWFSQLERIYREADGMKVLQPLLPSGVVPRILFEDRENYLLAMEAVDARHEVWKQRLLDGNPEESIAASLGNYLAIIHGETAGKEELRQKFGDKQVFRELRVDPFYGRVAEIHPDLRPILDNLSQEVLQTNLCLVHADFSPKNILITERGISLVDYETIHYGEPAFDLGFFLSHLFLKTVLHSAQISRFSRLSSAFWDRYRNQLMSLSRSSDWDLRELEQRTMTHLAGCLLSRIDGTSTVDYLPDENHRRRIRDFSRSLFQAPPTGVEEALQRLKKQLQE